MRPIERLANMLDAQLAILAIEGISSSLHISEWEEEELEFEETICPECGGAGEIEPDSWDDLMWDFVLQEYVPAYCGECEKCEGTGVLEDQRVVSTKYRESWLTSNIII